MSAGHHTKAWPRVRRRVLTQGPPPVRRTARAPGIAPCGGPPYPATWRDGGSDDLGNLITLCYDCHRARHASVGRRETTRGAWADLLYKGMVEVV